MKKSYFIRSLNITLFFLATALLTIFLGFITKHFVISLPKTDITIIQYISNIIKQVSICLTKIGLSSAVNAFVLITIELIERFKNDKIVNYFKSVYYTMIFRHFLTQTEHIENVTTIETQTTTTYSPINNIFNRAVKKCAVDIRQEHVTVFVKTPSKQQAQKLLNEMEAQIKEEIANRNPDYYFSAPTREKNALWFEGKKR